jgi:SnoaL-like domain
LRHAVRGRPALREFFGAFMNPAHRHNTFTFISYSGNAYGGAIEWTWTTRHRAPFLDLPAEGKETRIRGVSVVRFKAEKIVEQRCRDTTSRRGLQVGADIGVNLVASDRCLADNRRDLPLVDGVAPDGGNGPPKGMV